MMEVFGEETFEPWMQVKRKNRRNNRDKQNQKAKFWERQVQRQDFRY